ncbi:MAG: PilT/PilU family type 4a pilus ATPase [Nitrospirae bacterium]|nr:MAG: PilT/PilU family type 4a pilus ATPase [Nitrospirota bacterium]
MDERSLQQILAAGVKYGASDVHFKAGMAPLLRVSKDLNWIKAPQLSPEDTEVIAQILLARSPHREDSTKPEIDTSYEIPDVGRFRVNIFRQMGRYAIIMRVIPLKAPSFDNLILPPSIQQIAEFERGLVLVAGATGSGKSSTLAAIINRINETRKCHIVTIEDPVEFIHRDLKSSITQREIGLDTPNFASALRATLRQDPDVVLVGEMRDYETIDIAIKAAETGHLVFSTVHTTDTAKTINRLMSVFPSEEQNAVRFRLSESLMAVVAQRLLPRQDSKGMIAACEIMINTLSIKECIINPEKLGMINDFISKGRELLGTQTFDQHLSELFKDGKITLDTAKSAATNPSDLERSLHCD